MKKKRSRDGHEDEVQRNREGGILRVGKGSIFFPFRTFFSFICFFPLCFIISNTTAALRGEGEFRGK